ncbi:ATP-binding protein [Streptomyces muensis]|uniref:LuxR C-terminal-related transcriptional regulator n=1 Tax=Streptomyces muensis TaxID=1077944 RepID=A0A9X1TQ67_STRM4|nr:LuxR C-terminal-related transcriptional regulator [Streptomyces muensis]MCF1592288.1 LuxR C-terminal-related transcriptional regulator [Streptomyces muensis]
MTNRTTGVGLPAALTRFVGRGEEIAEARRRLGTARLLTLTGVGGVGKTRLALEIASASGDEFPDGVWLVNLAPVVDPSAVAGVVAVTVGIPDISPVPVAERVANHLAGRRALVLLDNCEHLQEACAELVYEILTRAAEVRILATSRRALGVTGEYLLPVLPLAERDALELLADRVAALRPDFCLTPANRSSAARLCADLDGLPLAIELAAPRLRTLTLDQLVTRLEDRFALIVGRDRAVTARHRSLRALVEYSYELCSPSERLLWTRLSVFVGGFTLDAVEEVCVGEGIATAEVLELLEGLVTQSVVFTCERDGLPGYYMLESVRLYGAERLTGTVWGARLRQRHRDFYLALTARLADTWCGPEQAESLARLRSEHRNLREALESCDDPQAGVQLAAALYFHWYAGGFLGEGRRILYRVLAAAPEPTAARGRALWIVARMALIQADRSAAQRYAEEIAKVAEHEDDLVLLACLQDLRGALAQFDGHLEAAASHYEDAAATFAELRDEFHVIVTLGRLALVRAVLGDPRAADTGRRAVATSEAHGERLGRGLALGALAYEAYTRGDREAVLELIRNALGMQQGFNNHILVWQLLEILAWSLASRGDHLRAGQLLGAAHALARQSNTEFGAAPYLTEGHTECEKAVLQVLGPTAYAEALAEGDRYDNPVEAIGFALSVARDCGDAPAALASPSLTRREREVAGLVSEGMSNRQIAARLGFSPRTADRHVENIRAKLDFRCRAQIAVWWTQSQVPTS